MNDTFPMACNFKVGSYSKSQEILENFLKSLTTMPYSSSSLPEVEHSSSPDSFLAYKARDFFSFSFDYFGIFLDDHLVNFEVPMSSSSDGDANSFDSSIAVTFALHLGSRALRNFQT
nr:hypothetical protein [Tanacetum cinerariifolium]